MIYKLLQNFKFHKILISVSEKINYLIQKMHQNTQSFPISDIYFLVKYNKLEPRVFKEIEKCIFAVFFLKSINFSSNVVQ